MSAPKAHAEYAASSSDRWVNCPASLKLIKKSPPQKSGAAADEGTLAHSLMEVALENHCTAEQAAQMIEDDIGEKCPEDMIDHIQGFIDFVRAQMQPHFELLIEEKVYLDFIHPTEAFGTVDVAIIEPFGALHIIDLKYGQGYVNHRDNPQMIYYALGIAHKHKYDFDEIKTTIYQPRAGSTDVARTDSFSVEKLKSWSKIFSDAVVACEDADEVKDVHAGSWCKFCPAKINCPAITKSSFEMAKLDFGDAIQPAPKSLTSSQLKTILDRSAYIKLWIKEVEKHAEDMIKSGKKIEGWGLVPTRAQKTWRDLNDKNFVSYISFMESVEEISFRTNEIVSPAQAEKILKRHVDKDVVERFMNDFVVAVSSGEKLSQINNDYDLDGLDDLEIY